MTITVLDRFSHQTPRYLLPSRGWGSHSSDTRGLGLAVLLGSDRVVHGGYNGLEVLDGIELLELV